MMLKINLADLANQVSEQYKDVECSFGTIRVYHTPEPLIWSIRPDWTPPSLPQVTMTLATGQKQRRNAKAGDEEYVEWERENGRYEQEKGELQLAARYIMALRDVEYPDISEPPPFLKAHFNGHYPANEMLRKKLWLDATILAKATDVTKIFTAMMQLGGAEEVTDSDVSEVKKNLESAIEESDLIDP